MFFFHSRARGFDIHDDVSWLLQIQSLIILRCKFGSTTIALSDGGKISAKKSDRGKLDC